MASKHLCRVLTGVLRGVGSSTSCNVEVEEIAALGFSPARSRIEITWVEKKLPEGKYVLLFRGELVDVRLSDGRWLAPAA